MDTHAGAGGLSEEGIIKGYVTATPSKATGFGSSRTVRSGLAVSTCRDSWAIHLIALIGHGSMAAVRAVADRVAAEEAEATAAGVTAAAMVVLVADLAAMAAGSVTVGVRSMIRHRQ